MSIGETIRARRTALGMTQAALADAVQVDQSMICQLERGSKVPTVVLAKQIADELHCTLNDLVLGRNEQ